MSWKGIMHTNPGVGIETLEEWMSEELHELDNGETFPETPNDYDFFVKTDDKHLYINVPET